MDLTQTKLTKSEWEQIEISVSLEERRILDLICKGFHDSNLQVNNSITMYSFTKIERNKDNEWYLYNLYFKPIIDKLNISFVQLSSSNHTKRKNPNSIDTLRIQNIQSNIEKNKSIILEFTLLHFVTELLKPAKCCFYLYTLLQMRQYHIENINFFVQTFVNQVLDYYVQEQNPIREIVFAADECIEQNKHLIEYEDLTLFSHQKQLFELFKPVEAQYQPCLVLYTAPTGTGKTLSPLGLSEQYRVIFVCVARHIGLSLAKSAISMGKRIAFAFGCETASDIRLHNFAAVEYTKNNKSGGIYKVDNSIGTKVEIMICDVKSYIVAMYYMLSFNSESRIITYWDEPTITMDYESHELHASIHRNWTENKISKLVLSCATLPRQCEITATLADFESKFENAQIHTIQSFDCKKTISLLNSEGKCVLPHLLFRQYRDMIRCVNHCQEQKTLLRYFDIREVIRFIRHVEPLVDNRFKIEKYFQKIEDINMLSLKIYYLELMKNTDPGQWVSIHEELKTTLQAKFHVPVPDSLSLRKIKSENGAASSTGRPLQRLYSVMESGASKSGASKSGASKSSSSVSSAQAPPSGILLTTKDAHTLTDGPTIYIVEDVMKIGKFYIQQSQIPQAVFETMMNKIYHNNVVQSKLSSLEKTIEDELGKEAEKEKKMEREHFNANVRRLKDEFTQLQSQIYSVYLHQNYVPNTREHQEIWIGKDHIVPRAFIPTISEEDVRRIMMLEVETQMKILLLLGIGVFVKHSSIAYMEIMKSLAYDQKLFLIIASSDYIYGTNYQFCHGFLGKDLLNMTQQKTIQALGRVGRNNIQQNYTIRFRDDAILTRLFLPMETNLEAIQMSSLFCGDTL